MQHPFFCAWTQDFGMNMLCHVKHPLFSSWIEFEIPEWILLNFTGKNRAWFLLPKGAPIVSTFKILRKIMPDLCKGNSHIGLYTHCTCAQLLIQYVQWRFILKHFYPVLPATTKIPYRANRTKNVFLKSSIFKNPNWNYPSNPRITIPSPPSKSLKV